MMYNTRSTDTIRISKSIIDIPNLQCLDHNDCTRLITRHLRTRQLEGRWQAVKHDCAFPHIHVILNHKTRPTMKKKIRAPYDK